MKNKKILILLGIVLSSLIIFLVVYAISLNNTTIQPPPPPLSKIKNSQQLTIKDKEQRLAELEALKKEMNAVQNESFKVETLLEGVEDCDSEDSEKYQDKIIAGQASMAEGVIVETANSYLKIQFKQGSLSWTSVVNIDKNTSIATINKNSEQIKIPLTTLLVGEKVVVQSVENITNDIFVAGSVLKFI